MRSHEIRTLAGAHGLRVVADRFPTALHDVDASGVLADAHPGSLPEEATRARASVVTGRSAGDHGGAAGRSDVERLWQREQIRLVQRRKAHRRARRLGHRIP
jgi:hypothetical protein